MKCAVFAVVLPAVVMGAAVKDTRNLHPLAPVGGHVQAAAVAPAATSPLLYHNGPIMKNPQVKSIFWGSKWANTAFQSDKITGIDKLFKGWSNSSYARTNIEYYGTNGYVLPTIQYQGYVIDTTSTYTANPNSETTILAEVCKMIKTPDPTGNGFYPVFTDIAASSAYQFCGWHTNGLCNGVNVQYAFFFDMTGSTGCFMSSQAGYNHTNALAALASVTAHELSEALTDPQPSSGWVDAAGQENADKCAWKFNGAQTLADGTKWVLQGNWGNRANGCIWAA